MLAAQITKFIAMAWCTQVDSTLGAQLARQLSQGFAKGMSLSEHDSEGLCESGSVAYSVERPTWETQAEQYSDTVLRQSMGRREKLSVAKVLLSQTALNLLSVPDVSRERRCLQTSPEQLMVGQKFEDRKNTEIRHLGSLPSGGQTFPDTNSGQ